MNKSNDQLDTLAIYPLIPFAIEKKTPPRSERGAAIKNVSL